MSNDSRVDRRSRRGLDLVAWVGHDMLTTSIAIALGIVFVVGIAFVVVDPTPPNLNRGRNMDTRIPASQCRFSA